MTNEQLSGYCGVILVFLAKKDGGSGLSVPRAQIDTLLSEALHRPVDEQVIRLTVQMLNRCDISYIEDDPVTGSFISISANGFNRFIERVAADRRSYDNIVDLAGDPNNGLIEAESKSYRYLELYEKYDALRKYAQFGDDWARLMISKLREGLASKSLVPASDRVVLLTDNSEEVSEIVAAAVALRTQLLIGNDLGDLTPEQAQAAANEVAQLEVAFTSGHVRAGATFERARATLEWIAKEAGGALVGMAATALFVLIAKLLGY